MPQPPAHVGVGQLRKAIELALRLGDAEAARCGARALLQHYPGAVAPLVLLGQALLELGEVEAAIEHLRRALDRNPLDATAWAGLAGALARAGQPAEAANALACAALHDPFGSETLAPGVAEPPQPLALGVIYLRRGMAPLAAAELAAALERFPRDDLRLHYIEALRRCGELDAARARLDSLATPECLPALLLRAALAAPHDAPALCECCARYDLDGQSARQFFAPETVPWDLPPPPLVAWRADLEPIAPYLALVPALGRKSLVSHRLPTPEERPREDAPPEGQPPRLDPVVSDVVATTERLRHRLADVGGAPGPLAPWNGASASCQVLLGSREALLRRYGAAGFAAIDERLRMLAAALRRRGIQAHHCYLDDAASLRFDDQIALTPVPREAPAIRDLIRSIGEALAGRNGELATLLLIGGDDMIPFHRMPNPLPDGDEAVLSDNPYASDDAGYLLPQRIVARLPEGAGDDPALLLAQLDRMLDQHHGRRPRGGLLAPLLGISTARLRPGSAVGYSAEVWRESSRAVLDTLDPDALLYCCPPLDADTIDPEDLNGRLIYLNLHGAANMPNWYGQPRAGVNAQLPVALRPDHFAQQLCADALIVSEACYGVDLAGRTPRTSIPLQALASGALALVGSTVNAYGSVAAPLLGADLLCQKLLAHLQRGAPIGQALHQARLELAHAMYRRQGYLDDVDVKTLTEFVLLGDPWAALAAPSAEPPAWPVSRLASIERVPKPRPKAVLAEEQVPREVVRRAREVLKRILPGAAAAPLHITAQPNPRRIRKGEAEAELVISAHENRPTVDGYCLAQTALITLSGNAVIKVALTR